MRNRQAAVVAFAALMVSGLLAACGGSSSSSGGSLKWAPCDGIDGPTGYQCSSLQVPLNPSHPVAGQTIRVALDRQPATGKSMGDLVVNPGGPGESSVDDLPFFLQVLSPTLSSHFDIIGYDPPGVGHSDPVQCGTDQQIQAYLHADPDPPTATALAAVVGEDRSFAASCEADSGRVLPYVSTVDAARDLDLVRQALGQSKLTFLGFSYGTFLGATYANLFPSRVRAMVLDGAVDPALDAVSSVNQQSVALQNEFQSFLAACVPAICAWNPGGSLLAAFNALMTKVRTKPVAVANSGGQSVGPSELLYAAAADLYSTDSWGELASALASLQHGDGGPVLSIFDNYVERNPDGSFSNVLQAETAVNCLDTPAPSVAQVEAGAAQIAPLAPTFGVADLYSEITCSVWPVPATGTAAPLHAVGAPPIVVVGSTGDPITPYTWAQALAKELSSGVLLTRMGDGHTAYGASSCIDSFVDAYLVKLQTPPPGTVCPTG